MHQAPLFYVLKKETNILYSNTLQQISHNYSQISLLFFTGRKYNIFCVKMEHKHNIFYVKFFQSTHFFHFKNIKNHIKTCTEHSCLEEKGSKSIINKNYQMRRDMVV